MDISDKKTMHFLTEKFWERPSCVFVNRQNQPMSNPYIRFEEGNVLYTICSDLVIICICCTPTNVRERLIFWIFTKQHNAKTLKCLYSVITTTQNCTNFLKMANLNGCEHLQVFYCVWICRIVGISTILFPTYCKHRNTGDPFNLTKFGEFVKKISKFYCAKYYGLRGMIL